MAESLSHKFGQLIGDLLELAILPNLKKFARKHNLFLDKSGIRNARKGIKVSWPDGNGNKHDLDFVLEHGGTENIIGTPVAFIESAWRRGSRHSKNKAQEIQGAINPIVLNNKTTVSFKGAILGGDFTKPSIKQLESDNFSVLYFPTELFEKAFKKFNLDIISDDTTQEIEFEKRILAWENFQRKEELHKELLKLNKVEVDKFFNSFSDSISRFIVQVIILPLHGLESISNSVTEAINFLTTYSEDKSKLPHIRYEIIIRYNTGDKIEVSFKEKRHTIDFLEKHL
ncbi:MAG TPA: DNA methylase [Bacteroidia bacterium]|jgi:hypothetical protein|nr:DNA methylase [Bacteroidia bacterium]